MMSMLDVTKTASIMILAILVVRALAMNRLPKRTFLMLWGLALLRLLVPVAIPSRFSVQGLGQWLRHAPDTVTAAAVPAAAYQTIGGVTGTLPAQPQTLTAADAAAPPAIPWPLWLWLAGACLLAVYFIAVYVQSRRRFATSLPVSSGYVADWLTANPLFRRVQARQTDLPYGPLAYGLLRPVILLPKRALCLPEDRLAYILAHELTHIRRFDGLFKFFLTIALCLHWFNPLVWLAFLLANRDMELACDERVVRAFGEPYKAAYAMTLLGMEERRGRVSPLLNSFSKYAIEERITAIMKMKQHTRFATLLSLALVLVLALCLGTTALAEATLSTQAGLASPAAGEPGGALSFTEVEWYTYEEYKAWLDKEKADLQSLVGTDAKGWTATKGVFEWTQEAVDETIAMYEGILEDIRNGLQISKPSADGGVGFVVEHTTTPAITSALTVADSIVFSSASNGQAGGSASLNPDGEPATYAAQPAAGTTGMTVTRGFSATVVIDEKITIEFGPFETQAAVETAVRNYLGAMVQAGQITNEDAQKVMEDLQR